MEVMNMVFEHAVHTENKNQEVVTSWKQYTAPWRRTTEDRDEEQARLLVMQLGKEPSVWHYQSVSPLLCKSGLIWGLIEFPDMLILLQNWKKIAFNYYL